MSTNFWRGWAIAATALALLAAGSAVWLWRTQALPEPETPTAVAPGPEAPAPPPPDRLVLTQASFAELPGWGEDALEEALPALRSSCRTLSARSPTHAVGPDGLAGTAADWQAFCRELRSRQQPTRAALAELLERELTPHALANNAEPEGLFTGYYEPSLRGARKKGGKYQTPLYRAPRDLVRIDLGKFRPEWKGKKIAGRFEAGSLVPYHDRAAIYAGALARRGLELVWVDDPVDAFFLEVQGSGRVELAEGGTWRLGYAGGNGQPYFAIGRELIDRGALTKESVSMQAIRAWLLAHPDEARALLEKNPSYVFFRRLEGEGPLGSLGVPLTPGRSLAVDTSFLPLAVPLWLATTAPSPKAGEPDLPLRRLMAAQDTGGAITGPVRGDVFWGHGPEAYEVAGRMKNRGRLWVLLPKQRPAE